MKKFILGFIAGGIICAAVTGFAVEYAVTPNPYPVKVNGVETTIQGYNINDETYFKLRDVSAAVGGFEVGFENNTITVDTETVPEPTTAPSNLSAADITIVKGEDGKDYTSDGLEIEYVDGIAYVADYDIQKILNEKGFNDYSFSVTSLVKFEDNSFKKIIGDIPRCSSDTRLIELNFYISTLSPFINNL